MECRNFQITLVSADNLPNFRSSGKMKVYAEVSINGEKTQASKRTNVDMVGETNPRWDFPLDFTVAESAVREAGSAVEAEVKLYCKRTLRDKYIGAVKIPLKGLFDSGIKAVNELSYVVLDTTTTGYVRLNILYRFGDMFVAPDEEKAETRDSSHHSFGDVFATPEALALAKALQVGLEVGLAAMEIAGEVMK